MQPHPVHSGHLQPAAAITRHAAGSMLLSLAFWITLTSAAIVLAAVQLAPGLVRWHNASQIHQQHARELQQLENELQHLERLTATLTDDPEFLAAVRSGQHSLTIARTPPRNQLTPNSTPLPPQPDSTAPGLSSPAADVSPLPGLRIPGFSRILHHTLLPAATTLAANPRLRHQLLCLAALATLLAFTCLNDSGFQTARLVITLPLTFTAQLWNRYRRIHQIPTNPSEPVADSAVRIIIPEETRSDSSVGRATDS